MTEPLPEIVYTLIKEWSELKRLFPTVKDSQQRLRVLARISNVQRQLREHGVERFVSETYPDTDWFAEDTRRTVSSHFL